MQLIWRPSIDASCFHAADAMLAGHAVLDRRLVETMQVAVGGLDAALSLDAIDRTLFFEHLIPQSIGATTATELAEIVLVKIVGSGKADSMTARYAIHLRDLQRAYEAARPHIAEELPRRGEPLEQQWRARGPGLLKEIGRLTDESLLVERAEVLLVDPVLGGGGAAHMLYNSVRIEAVLANPDDRLPEVVRLAWLLASLNLDLPIVSERLHRDRLRWIGPLSMLPVVLAAGAHVELVQCDAATIETAITAWRCNVPSEIPAADVLVDWWQTYTSRRPSWSVALAALGEILST